MGTKYTPDQLCGFLIPYRWDPDHAADRQLGTHYTEADPQFGAVTWSGTGRPGMQIEVSGDPSTGVTELQAQVVAGGAPDGAAGVAWSTNGTTWYGRDGLVLSTGYQRIRTEGRSPSLALLRDSSSAYMIWYEETTPGVRWGYRSAVRTSAGAWTVVGTITTVPIGAATQTACDVAQGPDGSLIAAVAVPTRTGGNWQIDLYRSSDGASWRRLARRMADTSDGTPPRKIRMEFDPATGTGLMLVSWDVAGTYTTLQYFSSDGGATWAAAVGAGLSDSVVHDLVFVGGLFVAIVDNRSLTPDQWQVYRTGQASQDVFASTAVALTAGSPLPTDEGGACLVADERGRIVAYVTDDTTEAIGGYVSEDYGASFDLPAFGSLPLDGSGGTAVVAGAGLAGLLHRGTAVLVSSAWDGAAVSGGLYELRCGGAASVTMSTDIDGWKYFYIPTDDLVDFGWAATDTGAPTITRSEDTGQSIVCGAGDTASRRYTEALAAASYSGWFAACVRVTAGTATLNFRAPGAGVLVEVTSTQIRAYDETGAAGSWTSHGASAATEYVEVLACVNEPDAQAAVWWRVVDRQAPAESRAYTELATLTSLGAAGNDARHWISATVSTTVHVLWAGVQYADATYPLISAGQEAEDLAPLLLSAAGPTYAGAGASLRAIGGTSYPDGETYTSDVTSVYARGNIDPRVEPSPRRPWRSSGSTSSPLSSTTTFRHTLDPSGGATGSLSGSDVIGIWLDRLVGVPEVRIEDAGGIIATLDLRQAITYQREGSTVRPTSAAGTAVQRPWVAPDELAGGYVQFATGDIRRISHNTAGALTDTGTPGEHRCTIWVEGVDGTEGASGSGYIWPPRTLILWYQRGSQASILSYIDVRLLSTSAIGPEGYREIGVCAIGRVEFLGLGVDRTMSVAPDSGFDIETMPDRSTVRTERGPVQRTVEIAIVDTWRDVQQVRGSGVSPDYVVASEHASAYPAAARHPDPFVLEGLAREVDGSPVVWLPRVPVESGSGSAFATYWYGWGYGAVYGYLSHGRRDQLAVGQVLVNDGYRMNTVTITEEV